jgi:hypothetical protein
VDHFQSVAAKLDFKREIGTNSFLMEYEYETLTNFISPGDMPDYIKNLEQMKNALGYSLTWANEDNSVSSKPAKGGTNWAMVILGLVYLVILASIIFGFLRFTPKVPPVLPNESLRPITGLRGWLILPAIGLFVSPIRVSSFLLTHSTFYDLEAWHLLTNPSSTVYHSYWAPILIFEFLVNLTIITFDLFLLVLFFRKRRVFPRLYIIFLAFVAITTTLDNLLGLYVSSDKSMSNFFDQTLMQSYIASAIWIPYMLVSKRVKATFTR